VAVDRTHKLIVVAFRGTERCSFNFLNISATTGNCRATTDSISITAVPQFCAGCAIGSGWWGAWNEVKADVLAQVKAASMANSGFRVLTTGHSLGGILATVAAIELRNNKYIVDLVSSIRVGTMNAVFNC
jgi:hypothetical protein